MTQHENTLWNIFRRRECQYMWVCVCVCMCMYPRFLRPESGEHLWWTSLRRSLIGILSGLHLVMLAWQTANIRLGVHNAEAVKPMHSHQLVLRAATEGGTIRFSRIRGCAGRRHRGGGDCWLSTFVFAPNQIRPIE